MSRYDSDPLAGPPGSWKVPPRGHTVPVPVEVGQVVEDVASGFVGEIVAFEQGIVVLEDRHRVRRSFRLGPGFWVDGKPVELTRPLRLEPKGLKLTASGSVAVAQRRARVARASRILVEGRHDAELVEKVWGDDLRVEGVVVEYLGGIDDLPSLISAYEPGPSCRIGVLVDHFVPGSKESRLAGQVSSGEFAGDVLVVGHPFIDVWAAVKPTRVGLAQWPDIPRGTSWKDGICDALGWPHAEQADIAAVWRAILGKVTTWKDLDRRLVTEVERLIDFTQDL
jgi:hypothetical protein